MKKWMVILALLFFPALVSNADAGRIWWDAPTTYNDNTTRIAPADLAKITYRVYVDGREFASVQNGALEWNGVIPQQPGETKSYTATAEIPGQPNTKSVFTKPYVFTYYLMLNPPGNLQIHLGQ